MTDCGLPDPAAKLEDVLDLPFGTVLLDSKGVRHVFIGNTRNTVSMEFHFKADVAVYGVHGLTSSYSRVAGGFAKFPGLRAYIRK